MKPSGVTGCTYDGKHAILDWEQCESEAAIDAMLVCLKLGYGQAGDEQLAADAEEGWPGAIDELARREALS